MSKCIICNKRASFNLPGIKPAKYCAAHKQENMVDVNNKKCIYEACTKVPTYNMPGITKAIYCNAHKLDGMVNVKDKSCAV